MSVKNFRDGIRLTPVSADPLNPVEGQLQYSDGTHREKGTWQYKNAEWIKFEETAALDPYNVVVPNSQFETDTSGWTFTSDNGTNTFTRTTTNPLAGTGSGLIDVPTESTAIEGSPDITIVENIVTLDGEVQLNQKFTLEFDYEVSGTGGASYAGLLYLRIRENTGDTLVKEVKVGSIGDFASGVDPEFNLFTLDTPIHIITEVETISAEDTYKVQLVLTEEVAT